MPIDPITATLTAGTLVGNLIQGQDAKKQAQKSLAFQQKALADQLHFAKSARTDAYGNRVYYDETTGEWKTQLDPYQDRIIKAGEHEQLLGLTRDAASNRGVRERAVARGKTAGEDYDRTRSEYLYGPQPSEGASEDKLQQLLSLASGPENAGPATPNIRQKGNVPVVQSGDPTGTAGGINQLAKVLLQARQGAIGETGQRATARNNRYLPALQSFERTAGLGGNAPSKQSDLPDEINKQYGDMSKLISGAYTSGAKGVGSAYNNLTTATGKQFPSLSDSVKLAALMKGDTKTATKDDPPRYYGGSPETNEWLNPSTYNYS